MHRACIHSARESSIAVRLGRESAGALGASASCEEAGRLRAGSDPIGRRAAHDCGVLHVAGRGLHRAEGSRAVNARRGGARRTGPIVSGETNRQEVTSRTISNYTGVSVTRTRVCRIGCRVADCRTARACIHSVSGTSRQEVTSRAGRYTGVSATRTRVCLTGSRVGDDRTGCTSQGSEWTIHCGTRHRRICSGICTEVAVLACDITDIRYG